MSIFVIFGNTPPQTLGTATAGVSNIASRDDHAHAHGSLTDPTLHALATHSSHGFMSSSDKTNLDSLVAGIATGLSAGVADSNGPYTHTLSVGNVADKTLMEIAVGDPSPYANFYQVISSNFPSQAYHDDVFKMGWNIGQIIPSRGALTIEMESYFEGSNHQMEFHNAFISPSGALTRFLTFLGAVDGTEKTTLLLQYGGGTGSNVSIGAQNSNGTNLIITTGTSGEFRLTSQDGTRFWQMTNTQTFFNSATGQSPLQILANNVTVAHFDDSGNLNFDATNAGITAHGQTVFFPNDGTVAFYSAHIRPFSDGDHDSGIVGGRWRNVGATWLDGGVGSQLTAASTITPTSGIQHVTGATTINTISVANIQTSRNVRWVAVADNGAITFGATGNVAKAVTIAQNAAQEFVYDSGAALWYPVQ